MYSWMRFTWMSNSASVGTRVPVFSNTKSASFCLFSSLISLQRFWNSGSSAFSRRPCRRSSSLTHAVVPNVSVIKSDSAGLQNASHRRCVTPFVLFWNFSGITA